MSYPKYKIGHRADTIETWGRMFVRYDGPNTGERIHCEKDYDELIRSCKEEPGQLGNDDEKSFWRDPENIEEWLLFLPRPYGELAVEEFKKQESTGFYNPAREFKHIESPSIALQRAFSWDESKAGQVFWRQVNMGNRPLIATLPETKENKETIMKRTYCIDNTPEANALVKQLSAGKKGVSPLGLHYRYIAIELPQSGSYVLFCGNKFEASIESAKCEVWEFLKQVSELEDEKKEVKFQWAGYDVVITPETVRVGCQTITEDDISLIEDFMAESVLLSGGMEIGVKVTFNVEGDEVPSSSFVEFIKRIRAAQESFAK